MITTIEPKNRAFNYKQSEAMMHPSSRRGILFIGMLVVYSYLCLNLMAITRHLSTLLDHPLVDTSCDMYFSIASIATSNMITDTTTSIYNSTNTENCQIVDILSVGSLLKPSFQDSQRNTFGSHYAVRNFYAMNELMDGDQQCATSLTTDHIDDVVHFCDINKHTNNVIARLFRRKLFKPKKSSGWLCAQKRPIDGLYYVLNEYRNNKHMDLPNYTFIIDDDTYLYMDRLLPHLLDNFPYNTPHVVAGCSIKHAVKVIGGFPYGGFGTFLTRATIERLIHPINCSTSDSTTSEADGNFFKSNPYNKLFCKRLEQNWMGEKQFFVDGMSLIDLMYQHSYQQSFRNVSTWDKNSGYCFHSDHTLAYFFNFYHVAVPDHELYDDGFIANEDFTGNYQYSALRKHTRNEEHKSFFKSWNFKLEGECYYSFASTCNSTNSSMVCHYIDPNEMIDLHTNTAIA